jgi:hypothetical protein
MAAGHATASDGAECAISIRKPAVGEAKASAVNNGALTPRMGVGKENQTQPVADKSTPDQSLRMQLFIQYRQARMLTFALSSIIVVGACACCPDCFLAQGSVRVQKC